MKNMHRMKITLWNLEGYALTMYARGWDVQRRRRFIFWRESDSSLRARVYERTTAYICD